MTLHFDTALKPTHTGQKRPFIKETRFGDWFLRTDTWKTHVLCRALNDLQNLLPDNAKSFPKILDVGCGFGHSFNALAQRFSPDLIVGVDADPDLNVRSLNAANSAPCAVTLQADNAAQMRLPDNEFDMVFCHQTFHHIVEQESAMAEFFRVLKPGGYLLFAESTRRYIHSLPIKLLFRHPMEIQKTAEEYYEIIRNAGFDLPDSRISTPFLWWSRPDIGFFEWIGRPVPTTREETLVNAVAIKPIGAASRV
ncbi:MAG: Methyltransferase [Pseudomonadota bacterium]|nr:Methyltransferase [Pseudomonadota bacterium]MDQ5881899.1 Methyltransferase [Pseudomonadota bacterium]MDQ5905030.1 Methyltransferase [Pseudomonadota bacterium]